MSISSINSNLAALYAQQNISAATSATSNEVSALSSGNRLVNASTDVAALAIGTALQGQVSTLNTVVSSLSQGSSLLQVADGGLAQIQTILQRQQAIASEAQSGSLSSTQLGFLNQEFSALTSQVDSLASTTNFNGVNLLNGSIQGGTSLSTNTAAGSSTTAPQAIIGTIANNSGIVANNTFTLTVGGQQSIALKFGASTGEVGIGSTAADTAANLASALNNSGLSELADFRFSSDANGNVLAYYTGSAATIGNIPSVVSSTSNTTNLTNATGAAASFSASTAIVTVASGTINTGNTITIGSHTISFSAAGTNTTANASTTNAYGTVDADYTVTGGNINIDLGVANPTGTPPTTSTQNTLSNIAAALTAVAGNTGFTDLSGISFGSSATQLTATYSGASATPPTISTSSTSTAAATLSTNGVQQNVDAGTTILTATAGTNAELSNGSTFTIGGATVTFATSGADVAIGVSTQATLQNLAAYLNSTAGQAALASGSYAGVTFNSDATHLYAVNTTTAGTAITSGLTTSLSNALPTGATGGGGSAIADNSATGTLLTLGGTGAAFNLQAGNTFTENGVTVTFLANGSSVTNAATQIVLGTTVQATLDAIVSFVNSNKAELGINTNLVASDTPASPNSTSVILTNGSTTTAYTPPALTLAAGTPADVTNAGSSTTLQASSSVGTFSGTISAGDTITVGGKVFLVAANGTAEANGQAGTAQNPYQLNLAASPTTATTLASLVNFLNTGSQTGTTIAPVITNTIFSTHGTSLFAQNDVASNGTLTSSYSSVTNPSITGIVGQNLAAITSTGLGAGTTSAVGSPSGNLFVTNTGAPSPTNYGTAVDLSDVANNASFVGAFGGTGSIGAITATYIDTGSSSTSGAQFSVTVGNDTYTTNTITNAALTSSSAPVSLLFTGTANNAAAGGSFTLTLQPQSAISSQTGASQLATGINDALSTVSAYQNRGVVSFNNNYSAEVGGTETATLQGASLTFNSADFSNPLISSVSVSAPSTGSTDAKISVVVNGTTFSTVSGIGDTFGTNSTITLVSATNPDQTLTLTTGGVNTVGGTKAIDLSSASNAAAFQTTLSNALGLNNANAGLTFQAGTSTSSTIGVSIGSATSSALFGGASLDVTSSGDATTAYNTLTTALNTVSSLRASVGALEERFNYATSALQNASQNEGAAQSNLLDTDVASESTSFATSQVQLQAGIAVLAQANQLQQNLLKLIQ